MKIIRATSMGMCFGVRDALKISQDIENPQNITIYGELVHNEEVIDELREKGFHSLPESKRDVIPDTPEILITAHGVSEKERKKLIESGKKLIDTTCPLVQYVHKSAQRMQKFSYFIIVIGKANHVEVKGITGDLEDYTVVEKIEDVQVYDKRKIAIVCQTTTPPQKAYLIWKEIQKKNPGKEIKYINTICHPTRDRQDAVRELLEQVDAMVVVGGKHSNNTKQLVELSKSCNIPVLHVQTAGDIEPEWFSDYDTVGLTAGTSTLDYTVEEVYLKLLSLEGREEKATHQTISSEVTSSKLLSVR